MAEYKVMQLVSQADEYKDNVFLSELGMMGWKVIAVPSEFHPFWVLQQKQPKKSVNKPPVEPKEEPPAAENPRRCRGMLRTWVTAYSLTPLSFFCELPAGHEGPHKTGAGSDMKEWEIFA